MVENEGGKVVSEYPVGAGVNAPSKRARFQIWERDENGAVYRIRSLNDAIYNLKVGYAAFLSIRMPSGGWLHVELDQNEPEKVYATVTNVNTATRTHYTRAMRFFESRHITLSDFRKMVKAIKKGEKDEIAKILEADEQ